MASSTELRSAQLITTSITTKQNLDTANGDNCAIEFWRGAKQSWQIANEEGYLYIRNNWSNGKQDTYNQVAAVMDYHTGAAGLNYLAIGLEDTARDADYQLFVQGRTRYDIGEDSEARDHQFVIGGKTAAHIAFGLNDIQAYDSNYAVTKLILNKNGGTLQVGSTDKTCNTTINGNLTMTDYIVRTYTDSNQTPVIWMDGKDYDNWLWQVGATGGVNDKMYYGYGLKYIGTGSGRDNFLRLWADNQNGTELIAYSLNQQGQVGFGLDPNPNFQVFIKGDTMVQGKDNDGGNLFIQSGTGAHYAILRFGDQNNNNAAKIFLNDQSRSDDGGPNLFTIRNDIGNIRLDGGNVVVTKALTVGAATTSTRGHKLVVNGQSFMSDTLTFGTLNGIAFEGSQATTYMIRFRDNSSDAYGNGIAIGGGGAVVIGSGESSDYINNISGGDETLYLMSDGSMYFYTYCQDLSQKRGIILDTNRYFYPDANNTGQVGLSSNKFAHMYATTFHGDLDGNATTCSYPLGFTSRSTNATWGNTTGTTITSWNEVNGGSIDFRRDNPSSGKMSIKVDGRVYVNEGTNALLAGSYANGFWGMADPDGATNNWIRTTSTGIIPYQSGSAGGGHQSLGTSSWYFADAYIDNIHMKNRTFTVGTAVTATAQNFDGSNNVTIPINSVKEAYLEWGGKNFSGNFGPLDAALDSYLGANRFAGMVASAITIQYSRNSGASWADYGASEASKRACVTNFGSNFVVGANSTAGGATSAYWSRVIVEAIGVYTNLNKFVIYLSTSGSSGCTVTIERATYAAPSTWVEVAKDVPVAGWSGYNIINCSGFTYGGGSSTSNTSHNRYVRFTFKTTSANSGSYNGLTVYGIHAFGGVGWNTPSNLARMGHVYNFDGALNCTFPAEVTATKVHGAVWNDYAEFRQPALEEIKAGYIVKSNRQGQVSRTDQDLSIFDGVVSDTFGFSIGETETAKLPLAVSGRALVYVTGDRNNYDVGDVICATFDGFGRKMTREEIINYPDRIVGTVSEIPEYDIWGDDNIKVDGRIWIKVR